MNERMLSVGTIARVLEVSPETVRDWIRSNLMAAIQLPNGYYKIPRSELERVRKTRRKNKKPQANYPQLSGS